MSDSNQISDLLDHISEDIRLIVSDEIALVKAEIKPAVRRVGAGAGLFGAATYFAVSATIVLWFTIATGFAWLYAGVTPLSPWACVFLGTLTAVFLLLIVTVVFVVMGGKTFSKIHGPEIAPESIGETFTAIRTGLADGSARAAAEIRELRNPSAPTSIPVGGVSISQRD